ACINTGSKYNPNGIFGSNGIIESKAIMLKWIEEDPVDTWELGRNDSVQSITGTRNVFVDFPELAFDLFNEDIPNGYKSPSSSTTSSGYKITATANNSAWGKVSVTRNTVSAYASNGYEAVDYTIVSGKATVERIGDDFKVTTSGDVTIQINFAPTVKATFVENGETTRTLSTHKDGKVTLPSIKTGVYTGNSFLGWVTAKINETEKKPAVLAVGDKYSVAGNTTLYALYSAKKNGKTVYSTSAISAGASAGNTSSKNEQTVTKPSSKPSGAASSKPSSTTSKPSNVTTSKPSNNTSSKGEQNVDSKPIGDNNSVENEQNTSSILTETEDVFVTVNISEDTVVVSDFIEEAINNNIPLVLKAKDYTWNFEKIAMPLEDVRNFNAAILSGDEVAKEDKAVVKKAAGGKKFYAFDFAYEGNLPAKAVITMRVDDAFAGKTVEIYSLTPSGSKILEGTATVSSDSVLRFKTERTSLMFITDADANGGASLLWLWILIAVVVLGGAAAVFVVLYKREAIMTKNKQDLA
ncbi:MAG: endonuclease, partial [Oscillospiraceae bacterium]|nr:endonuclease [Oscillospiraceae bacterium]